MGNGCRIGFCAVGGAANEVRKTKRFLADTVLKFATHNQSATVHEKVSLFIVSLAC